MILLTQAMTFAAAIARTLFVVSFFVTTNALLAIPSVADAQVAPTCSVYASPSQVSSGGNVVLNWSSNNGTAATLTDFGTVGLNGSVSLSNVTTGKTYVLTVSNGSASVSCSAVVTIGTTSGGTGVTPTCSIDASSTLVGRNQPVSLTWSSTNGVAAAISSVGSVPLSGTQTVYPQSTTTYILTVTGNGVTNSCSRTVTVDPSFTGVPKCTLSSDPVLISNSTGSTTLTWTTQGATSISIDGIGQVAANGSQTVYGVTGTKTYTLRVTGPNGSHSCTQTVFGQGTVNGYNGGSNFVQQAGNMSTTGDAQNPGCYINVNPANVSNGVTTLSWLAAGAYSATISGMGNVATSGSNAVTPNGTTTYTLTSIGANGVTRTCATTAYVAGTVNSGTYASNTQNTNYAYPMPTYSTQYQFGGVAGSNSNAYSYSGAVSPVSYGGRNVVALSSVPYTGFSDVFGALFSLATLVTSAYGATRMKFA
jgi:hypothetical protein